MLQVSVCKFFLAKQFLYFFLLGKIIASLQLWAVQSPTYKLE